MLSDEEKKEYEELKSLLYQGTLTQYGKRKLIGIIEKQSKEIEELKEKNKKLQDKAKELIFEKQELTSALLDSTPNDKIKAKTIEIKNRPVKDEFITASQGKLNTIIDMESLLEKE